MNLYKIIVFGFVFIFFGSCSSKEKSKEENKKEVSIVYSAVEKEGKELFKSHCKQCHSMKRKMTGPPLGKAIHEISLDWFKVYVKNPKSVIDSGDERAVSLYGEYNILMPNHQFLKDKDLESLYAFIKKESTK